MPGNFWTDNQALFMVVGVAVMTPLLMLWKFRWLIVTIVILRIFWDWRLKNRGK